MKSYYPIKYAIWQITKTETTKHEESDYTFTWNIVSKCHVVNKIEENTVFGGTNKYYEVIPLFRNMGNWEEWERINPCGKEKLERKTQLFDTYEKALKESNKLNFNIMKRKLETMYNCKTSRDELLESFFENVKNFETLQQLIEEKTDDLKAGIQIRKQSIYFKNGECAVTNDLDYFINLFKNDDYIVYSLTDGEYEQLNKAINKGLSLEQFNKMPLVENNPNQKVTRINGFNKFYYILNNETGSVLVDKIDIKFQPINNPRHILYTPETYEDLMAGLVVNSKEDEIEVNGKIMAKRIRLPR